MFRRFLQLLTVVLLGAMLYLYLHTNWVGIEPERPYVYRQLIPVLSWVPVVLWHFPSKIVMEFWIVLAGVGLWASSRWLYQGLFQDTYHTELFAMVHVVLTILLCLFPQHTYDLPTAFLFTLAMALLVHQRLIGYLYLFPLVVLNRETAIFLPLLFLWSYRYTLTRKTLWNLFLIQCLAYIFIQTWLHLTFRSSPGSPFIFMLHDNLVIIMQRYYVMLIHVLLGILLFSLIHARWEVLPDFVKGSLMIMLPSMTLLYLFFSYPLEFRVFLEALPILALVGFQP